MGLFGRKKKETKPMTRLASIKPYRKNGDQEGAILTMLLTIGDEKYFSTLKFPGLELHPTDINCAFTEQLDEPMEGGVILKTRDDGGKMWWVEITQEASQRAISNAKELGSSGKHENAATIYDSLGMFSEAGRMRQKEKTSYEYKVTVDFAQLMSKLGDKGISLTLIECPNCSGKVDIPKDGNVFTCKFCGKDVHAVDVFKKFKTVLGI